MSFDFTQEETCRHLCELAHQYLHGLVYRAILDLTNGHVSHQTVEEILEPYKRSIVNGKKLPLQELYQHFLSHAQNKSQGGNAIRKVFGSHWNPNYHDRWQKLGSLLGNFDPNYVLETYKTRDELRRAILKEFNHEIANEPTEPVEDYISTIFCLGQWFVLQAKEGRDINEYFNLIYINDPQLLIRTLLLSELADGRRAFFGFGDALLRDALKELGYHKFVKADGHVIDIARGIGIISKNETNKTKIAQSVEAIANILDDELWSPYRLDKLFFLIGSGDIHHDSFELSKYLGKRNSTARKAGFIDFVKERLSGPKITKGTEVALLSSQSSLIRGKRGKVLEVDAETWLVEVDFGSEVSPIYISDLMVLH